MQPLPKEVIDSGPFKFRSFQIPSYRAPPQVPPLPAKEHSRSLSRIRPQWQLQLPEQSPRVKFSSHFNNTLFPTFRTRYLSTRVSLKERVVESQGMRISNGVNGCEDSPFCLSEKELPAPRAQPAKFDFLRRRLPQVVAETARRLEPVE
jgi:hypothetical protein